MAETENVDVTTTIQALVVGDSNMVRASRQNKHFLMSNGIKVMGKSGLELSDYNTITGIIGQGLLEERSVQHVIICLGINDALRGGSTNFSEMKGMVYDSLSKMVEYQEANMNPYSLYFVCPYLIQSNVRHQTFSQVNGKLELIKHCLFDFVLNCANANVAFIPRPFSFRECRVCLEPDDFHLNSNGLLRHFLAWSSILQIKAFHLQEKYQSDVVTRKEYIYFGNSDDLWSYAFQHSLGVARQPQFRHINLNGHLLLSLVEVDISAEYSQYACLSLLDSFVTFRKMKLSKDHDPQPGTARKNTDLWKRALCNHLDDGKIIDTLNICVVCLAVLNQKMTYDNHFYSKKHKRHLENVLSIRVMEDSPDMPRQFDIVARDNSYDFCRQTNRVSCIVPMAIGNEVNRPTLPMYRASQADMVVSFQTDTRVIRRSNRGLESNGHNIGAIQNYHIGKLVGIRYFIDYNLACIEGVKPVLSVDLTMVARHPDRTVSRMRPFQQADFYDKHKNCKAFWFVNWQPSNRSTLNTSKVQLTMQSLRTQTIDIELDYVGSFNQLIEVSAFVWVVSNVATVNVSQSSFHGESKIRAYTKFAGECCHGTVLIPFSVVMIDFTIYRCIPEYTHSAASKQNTGEDRRFIAFQVEDTFGASKVKSGKGQGGNEYDSCGDIIPAEDDQDVDDVPMRQGHISRSLVCNSWEVSQYTSAAYNELESLYNLAGSDLIRKDGSLSVLVRTSPHSVTTYKENIAKFAMQNFEGVSLQPTINNETFFPWLLNSCAVHVQNTAELLPLPYELLDIQDSFVILRFTRRLRGKRISANPHVKTSIIVRVRRLPDNRPQDTNAKSEFEFLLDVDRVEEIERDVYRVSFRTIGAISTAKRTSWFPHDDLITMCTLFEVSNYRCGQRVASSLTGVITLGLDKYDMVHPLKQKQKNAEKELQQARKDRDHEKIRKLTGLVGRLREQLVTLDHYRSRLMQLIDMLLHKPAACGSSISANTSPPIWPPTVETSSSESGTISERRVVLSSESRTSSPPRASAAAASSSASSALDYSSIGHGYASRMLPSKSATTPKSSASESVGKSVGHGYASRMLPSITPGRRVGHGRGRGRARIVRLSSPEKPSSSATIQSMDSSETPSTSTANPMSAFDCAAQQPEDCGCNLARRYYAEEILHDMKTYNRRAKFLEGVPGSGKSTICGSICKKLYQSLFKNKSHAVLLAVTNVAADNLAEKLLEAGIHRKDILILAGNNYYQKRSVREKWKNAGVTFTTVPSYTEEVEESSENLAKLMGRHMFVVGTVSLASDFLNRVTRYQFWIEWMFIDEASQVGILEFFEAAMKSERIILCGDKHQGQVYAPLERQFLEGIYYKCSALHFAFECASAQGEEFLKEHCMLLCGSYRCNAQTCALQSLFWNMTHCIIPLNAEARQQHLEILMEREDYLRNCFNSSTFSIVHVQGEQMAVMGQSCVNLEEAAVVLCIVQSLYRTCTRRHPGISGQLTIGILCIHTAQVELINRMLEIYGADIDRDIVEVETVASCQGRTYDFVVLSLVESSYDDDICCPRLRETLLDDRRSLTIGFSRHKLGMLIVTNAYRFMNNGLYMSRIFSFIDANSLYWNPGHNAFSAARRLLTAWEIFYGLDKRGVTDRLCSLVE